MYFPLTKPHRRDDPVIVLQLYPFLCDLCRENAPASFFLCKADFQNVNDSFLTHLRNVALKDLNLHFTTGIIKSRILPGPVPVKCVTSYFFFLHWVRQGELPVCTEPCDRISYSIYFSLVGVAGLYISVFSDYWEAFASFCISIKYEKYV